MMADNSWQEKYKDDESVVLGYTSNIFYEEDGATSYYGKILIQILTDAGATSWTEYNFNFLGDLDVLKVIKKDGAEIIPDFSGGFVVFKNLEPGDMIMVEGSSSWRHFSDLGYRLDMIQTMMFHAPIHYANVQVALPEGMPINYSLHKLNDPLTKSTKDGYDYYQWEYDGIPQVVWEDAVLDEADVYANIMINTSPDWSEVVNWFMAKTYRKTEPNYEIKNILDTLIQAEMSDQEKMIAIYNYITKNITYSFTTLLQTGYIPKSTSFNLFLSNRRL